MIIDTTARPPLDIAVLGIGQTPFSKHADEDSIDLAGHALRMALRDGGVAPSAIGMVAAGTVYEGPFQGQRILMRLGMNGIPIINVENACSSGSTAIVEAIRWIQSGEVDVAAAVGVELFASRYARGPIPLGESLKGRSDRTASDPIVTQGLMLPSYYGLYAERHMALHGSTRADWAAIAYKNRMFGAKNPNARFQNAPSLEEILASPIISSPLGRYDCCGNADGAAAVVLANGQAARRHKRKPIWLRAAVMSSGELGDRYRHNPMKEASQRAFGQAGVEPSDVDVAEVHDNFSPAELECYEDLGFCPHGEGHIYLRKGRSGLNGGGAVFSPSGGLLGRGHAPGATGIVQLMSVIRQLRGDAGDVQQQNAKVGITHTSGGGVMALSANVCVMMVATS